ncbi:MAG: MBL fold metallo-hydrolase [Halieaceae bacterium]
MRFASLGSGSKGNATLVQSGTTLLLVDCGFSLRETEARLQRRGLAGEDIDALLVTHEHTDHCSGVARLSRKYQLPVYMSRGTWASGRCEGAFQVEYFHSDARFQIGDITVAPIAVPHDAREPCQFVLQVGDLRLGILTDLGSITSAVTDHYRQCDALLLECNHDREMLQQGPYPYPLKQRVGGDWGHLNNQQAAELLARLQGDELRHLVVAHISEQNNHRDRVLDALGPVFSRTDSITWADQVLGFEWLELG